MPKNIASIEAPSTAELVESHVNRMKMTQGQIYSTKMRWFSKEKLDFKKVKVTGKNISVSFHCDCPKKKCFPYKKSEGIYSVCF